MKYSLMFALAASAWGQQIDLSMLDRLASRATEAVNVNLDSDKLKLATTFMSGEDSGTKTTRDLVSGLKGVYVRTFKFGSAGEYAQTDLDAIRNQLKGPNWSRLVDVKGKQESVEVWFHTDAGKMGGMLVLTAEPRELVAVNIVGPIDIGTLASLSGKMGLPSIDSGFIRNARPSASGAPKKDE